MQRDTLKQHGTKSSKQLHPIKHTKDLSFSENILILDLEPSKVTC